ncbi:unnamed protein product [Ostreobium quekettii]|uniref:Uncharacterized protein n=1 Tax=Ostreobium quekettii TaxID=121088 RepID=A0A8S1J4U2_9CHLO|nr:unnamed protein product [Ostreobium quekettii]|eukprot:evm.model.scf_245.9 EVM.evm.TU.scf_245.9   scf_245:70779-73072(-)
MSTGNSDGHPLVGWGEAPDDVMNIIWDLFASRDGKKTAQEFVKFARLVNKHWCAWANRVVRCVTIPMRCHLVNIGTVCFKTDRRPSGVNGVEAKWLASGTNAARRSRERFFKTLKCFEMLEVVAVKFPNVEQLTMAHNMTSKARCVPHLRRLGSLRRIVLKGGNMEHADFDWLQSLEHLRCLSLQPNFMQYLSSCGYEQIGMVTRLEVLELDRPFDTTETYSYSGSMDWLKHLSALTSLHLGLSDFRCPAGTVLEHIQHLTSLRRLSLRCFKVTSEDILDLCCLKSLTSLTFTCCSMVSPGALTNLNALPALRSLTAALCDGVDSKIMEKLTSIGSLSVRQTFGTERDHVFFT